MVRGKETEGWSGEVRRQRDGVVEVRRLVVL